MVNDFYNWGTFEIFAKEITRSSDDDLIKKYSNHIIIIDEIHNIRIQKKDNDKKTIINKFFRFLHIVKNCKILLLSGTPMKDGVEEIASVMNLILPENQQLPIQDDFVDDYFDKNEEIYEVKDNMKNSLYSVFKGRVSYLRAMFSDVKRVYEGKTMGTLEHFNVFPDIMGVFQSNNYLKALLLDKEDRKGIYTKSRQASLFVFPDGSFGEEGFKNFSNPRAVYKQIGSRFDKLIAAIRPPYTGDIEKILKQIAKFVKEYGIPTATSFYMHHRDEILTDKIIKKVGLPCFVKPNRAGSSFGISKVYEEENLKAAIEKACQEDEEILIESFLDGTEVSVGVIEYQGKLTVLPITEIVSENDFFDYEAKYEGKSQEITPARISAAEKEKVVSLAKCILLPKCKIKKSPNENKYSIQYCI